MKIRNAKIQDLDRITAVEDLCFPKAEAATKESFRARLSVYPDHFWVLEENGDIISMINGMVTNEEFLKDEMYENATLHDEDGAWQMIFGLDTIPEYRHKGHAEQLMRYVIDTAQKQGRKGLVLTCKEKLIHYYEKFGFENEGVAESVHGGSVWYHMRLSF